MGSESERPDRGLRGTFPPPTFHLHLAGRQAAEAEAESSDEESSSGGGTVESAEIESAIERVRRAKMQWTLPDPVEPSSSSFGAPAFPFFELLMYLCAAALIILLVLLAASWIRNRTAPSVGTDEGFTLDRPPVQLTSRPLEFAKEAALRGDYEEAIHLLLLGTIEEIRGALGYDAPPWLTSREIVRLAPLPQEGVAPLEKMVRAVERSHFGNSAVTKEEFVACAQWHGELRAATRRKRGSRGN